MSRLPARLLSAALLAVAGYYAVWGGEYSEPDLRRLRAELRADSVRAERMEREIDSLRQLAERLERDPATIERVARERFGMIRRGEILYRFVEVAPEPAAGSSPRSP